MTMYWIYDLHNWALGAVIVSFFVVTSLIGLFATRLAPGPWSIASRGTSRTITRESSNR